MSGPSSSEVVVDVAGAEAETIAASCSVLDKPSMLLDADSGEPDTDTVSSFLSISFQILIFMFNEGM